MGVTLRIYTRHVTPVEERKIISNAANKNRMDRSNTSDLQQTVLAESNLQDVTTIVAQMHRNREPSSIRQYIWSCVPMIWSI